ncbi:hypothetical protein N9A94_06655 [Akkermansiaceae bacterium]|nr:hypothetical protein [Akkermansiaceae bacterium]MDA7888152.1 hypothetical protein [Akkermansiaceae bacterium]
MTPHHENNFANEEERVFWIENIISKFQEGTATPDEVEQFRALLLEDPEARGIYRESNELTLLLDSASFSLPMESKKPRALFPWAAGIAALLAIGLWLVTKPTSDPIAPTAKAPWLATLSSSHEAMWESPESISANFQEGRIKLLSGIAELEFQNGAQFVLEGPCELELIDEDSIELVSGKLWGHCPPDAHGFEVLAPGGNRIVDLGTEFGVGVDPKGSVDVHVFDGEVEVFSQSQEKQALKGGSAIQILPGEKPLSLAADFNHFTDSSKLQHELYRRHHASLLKRDDLLLYYDFASLTENSASLLDLGTSGSQGEVSGALPVMGRMAGKNALLFEKKSDAVEIDLEHLSLGDGFTLAMWIKPTNFSKSHMTLFSSNGFDPGRIHFQIHDDGRLMTSIAETARFASPRETIKTNTWQLVAVRWDFKNQTARLYVNGQPLRSIKSTFAKTDADASISFAKCQIGAWAQPTYGHNRSFVGRIDEVMLFSGLLSDAEMARVFEESRP